MVRGALGQIARHFSAEGRVRIVLGGRCDDNSMAEPCQRGSRAEPVLPLVERTNGSRPMAGAAGARLESMNGRSDLGNRLLKRSIAYWM